MTKKTGTLLVALSATGFGSMSIFAKYAYSAGVNLPTLLGIRFTLAALLLWIIVLITGPKPQLTIANTLTLFALGAIGYSSQSLMFFSSLQLIPASMAVMLFYIYPALVFIASLLLKTETITLRKVIALFMALIGLTLMLGTSFNHLNLKGLLFAFGSALVFTCFILLSNRVLKKVPSLVASTVICSSTAFAFLTLGIVGGTLSLTVPLQGWIAIIVIAVFSTVFAMITLLAGLNRIGATQASIISVLEPAVTVVLSYLFLAETLQGLQLIGGIMILASIIILQMPGQNSSRRSTPISTLKEEI